MRKISDVVLQYFVLKVSSGMEQKDEDSQSGSLTLEMLSKEQMIGTEIIKYD